MSSILNLDNIKGLIYTEKSNTNTSNGVYTFEVNKKCNKSEIKFLIKKFYNVEVEKVNIINCKSKIKKFKGITGKTKSYKKALVTLKNNQTINFV